MLINECISAVSHILCTFFLQLIKHIFYRCFYFFLSNSWIKKNVHWLISKKKNNNFLKFTICVNQQISLTSCLPLTTGATMHLLLKTLLIGLITLSDFSILRSKKKRKEVICVTLLYVGFASYIHIMHTRSTSWYGAIVNPVIRIQYHYSYYKNLIQMYLIHYAYMYDTVYSTMYTMFAIAKTATPNTSKKTY